MNRVKQFFINAVDKMKEEDYDYVESNLREDEYKFFVLLSKSEQKHSVRVARAMERKALEAGFDKKTYIKLGLLHDIGKGERSPNIFEKSIIVILNSITKGNLARYQYIKVIDVYYNHPKKSAIFLKDIGLDEELIHIIENHHNRNSDSIHVKNLIECDDDN